MLRRLQTDIIDRNRRDSLLLVRIQNDLNMLGPGHARHAGCQGRYPLTAWRSQFQRIRTDLEDAVARRREVAPAGRTPEQARYLASSMAQFWDALDRMFELAARGRGEARTQVRLSLQARQAALEHRRLAAARAEQRERGAGGGAHAADPRAGGAEPVCVSGRDAAVAGGGQRRI